MQCAARNKRGSDPPSKIVIVGLILFAAEKTPTAWNTVKPRPKIREREPNVALRKRPKSHLDRAFRNATSVGAFWDVAAENAANVVCSVNILLIGTP